MLQVAGACAVIAFHVEAPGAGLGWAAVELFFVMAGMHMSLPQPGASSVARYLGKRYLRLVPEVAAVWLAVLVICVSGHGTAGMKWFILSAPAFLQNLTLPFFDYTMPADAIFGPLWFAAALMQLQCLFALIGRFLDRLHPAAVLAAAIGIGAGMRFLFPLILGGSVGNLDGAAAGMLYCMPFCHLEAMVLGILIKRGAFPQLGRATVPAFGLVILAGWANLHFGKASGDWKTLGYVFPLRENFSHVWGYPLLSLAAASLCSPHNPIESFFSRHVSEGTIFRLISALAAASYGAYCFHGAILSFGWNLSRQLGHSPGARLAVLAMTLIEVFLLAAAFNLIRKRFFERSAGS